ncbi:MAG: hypothetical protein ABSH38_09045 [Verrucomicrobiota bacterium]|jgi:hypothetical protein
MKSANYPQRAIVRGGVFYFENGSEVNLWGVNFQSNLYWEQGFRRAPLGLQGDPASIKAMNDRGFDEIAKLGCDLIRVHLTPADFTDEAGNLIPNQWLDMLGYLLAKAREHRIYVALTFLNQMEFSLVRRSFIANCPRRDWLFDAGCLNAAHNYIRQLINWKNPCTGILLKEDLAVISWEPVNEPDYIRYDDMRLNAAYRSEFEGWLRKCDGAFNDWYFAQWREKKVREIIDGFQRLLCEEGVRQPMVWNANWPRMMLGHEDVFRGIATSKADAVSFCCYPGQDEVNEPFLQGARDTSGKNYIGFLQRCHDDYDHLGWLKSPQFSGKAVTVYEFEAMYNAKNSYVHPAMAKLFRALRAQMATLWTYSFSDYADRFSGSHLFNIACTPAKAAGFAVAGEMFRHTAAGSALQFRSQSDDSFDGFYLSYDNDLAVSANDGLLIHSGDITGCPVPQGAPPRRIIGRGNSPFVEYAGTGLYFLEIDRDEIRLEILPHARFVRDPWKWWMDGKLVTELDRETPATFRLRLPGWEGARVFRVENGNRIPVPLAGPAFDLSPGVFLILQSDP